MLEKSSGKATGMTQRKKNFLYALAIVGPILMYTGSDLSVKSFLMSAIPAAVLIWAIARAKTKPTQ